MTRRFYWLLAAALLFRLAIAPAPGFVFDVRIFSYWARSLAERGPLSIYYLQQSYPVDYPPGYMFVLWAVGLVHGAFGDRGGELTWRLLLKIVPTFTDLAVIALVYIVARRIASEKRAFVLACLVAFAPPLWIDSSLWGQADSVPIAFAFAALVAVVDGRMIGGLPLLTAAILCKPQAIVIAPQVALFYLKGANRLSRLAIAIGLSLGLAYAATAPFTRERGLSVYRFLLDRYVKGVSGAAHTSNGAFSFYPLVSKFYSTDAEMFGPLPFHTWGIVLVVLPVVAITALFARALFLRPVDERRTLLRAFGAASLSLLALFLFATRMHERYLLPALVFGAPLALDDRPTAFAMGWLAVAFTINCLFILAGFYGGGHHPITVVVARACSAGNVIAFAVLWQRQLRRLA